MVRLLNWFSGTLLPAGARGAISFEFYHLLILCQGNEQEILCVKYHAIDLMFMNSCIVIQL